MRRTTRIPLVLAAALLAVGISAAPGASAPGLFFGFTEDTPKWEGSPPVVAAQGLGARAFRITVMWNPGRTDLDATQLGELDRAATALQGTRFVLAVYADSGAKTPLDDLARDQYCTFARNVVARYPAINDVVVWNEPNKTLFWSPQYNLGGSSAAPAAYVALLARCWDVLHAYRAGINVLAPATSPRGNDNPGATSNVSHSPGSFIREMGVAYRASGRQLPLFDVVGHHAYGDTSAERPWRQHIGLKTIAHGDWNKLMYNLWLAFDGTAQAIPGQCVAGRCPAIWYLESGFQTRVDAAKAPLYSGVENEPSPVPDDVGGESASPPPSPDSLAPDQATQVVDAVRLSACQAYVGGHFNFLLWDEVGLPGWQSGPFWVDHTPKDSYDDFQRAVAEANASTVDCTRLKGGLPSSDFMPPAAPGSPLAEALGPTTVRISWSATFDESGVTAYWVYRNGGLIAKTAATSHTDATAAAGVTYRYTVRAVDAAGNLGAASAVAEVTTPATICLDRFPTVTGTAGDDTLVGTPGDDVIAGLGGRDVLKGLGGNDRLCGGAGIDTADFSSAPTGVVVDLFSSVPGTATGEGADTLTEVENLTGSPFNDTLVGDTGANTLSGLGGEDQLRSAAGNDVLLGGLGNDFLRDAAGDDVVDGEGGVDTLDYSIAPGPVSVNLFTPPFGASGWGSESLASIENVNGSPYADVLVGSTEANVLSGLGGADQLRSAAGNDVLLGGPGTDFLRDAAGNDVVNGEGDLDTVDYSIAPAGVVVDLSLSRSTGWGSDSLTLVENVTGSPYRDVIVGSDVGNVLRGEAGNDDLDGRFGFDVCVQGPGTGTILNCEG